MKIYTRNGDKGETGLLGAIRVSKSHLVLETCGSVDELNSHIGCAVFHLGQHEGLVDSPDNPHSVLVRIQSELFDLGSRIAAAMSEDSKTKPADEDKECISRIESWIDHFDSQVPPLTNFILPGGSAAGSQMHLARTVCRRAERRLVSLMETGVERDLSQDLVYLNRLSDLLFVLSRFSNQLANCDETPWVAFSARDQGDQGSR